MGAKTALRTRLQAESGVTSLVSTRVYQSLAPSSATLPYVVFTQISDDGGGGNHAGANAVTMKTFQIDVYAATTASRESVVEAVRDAVDGVNATTIATVNIHRTFLTERGVDSIEGPSDASQQPKYRTRMELVMWHEETVPTF